MKEMLGGCCVCADENGWTDNPLIYCDGAGCEVAVHQGCYGIQEVPDGEWFCAKCQASPSTVVPNGGMNGYCHVPRCELCPFGFGALKRTETKGWAHVICALYIPEVRFGDVHSMQPVILSDVPNERFDKKCYLCENAGDAASAKIGACMSCNKPGCKRGFHVTCAQQKGLLCEEGGGSKNVKYCGYCDHHLRKAALDPAIKIIPPCRIRAHPTSTVVVHNTQPTPPSSNTSGHMLVDPIPRPEQVGLSLGGHQSSVADEALLNNFSPPLTTSSRSSIALDVTPPGHHGHHNHHSELKSEVPDTMLNGSRHVVVGNHVSANNNLNALVNAAMGQAAELTNHNRLAASHAALNGHADDKSTVTQLVAAATGKSQNKRVREPKPETGDKPPKRPRANNRPSKRMQTLLDLVSPVVSETVSDFQRERAADRTTTTDRRVTSVPQNVMSIPSTSQEPPLPVASSVVPGNTLPNGQSSLALATTSVPAASTAVAPSRQTATTSAGSGANGNGGAAQSSTLPSSMEQLLERQWDQASQFLLSQAQFDVAQLLSCLHQLKSENIRLEEQLSQLSRRKEHLTALNSRLSVPLSAPAAGLLPPQQATSQGSYSHVGVPQSATPVMHAQHTASTPHALHSPQHHSPHIASQPIPTMQPDDSLTQLRSLASGTRQPTTSLSSGHVSAPSTSAFNAQTPTSQHQYAPSTSKRSNALLAPQSLPSTSTATSSVLNPKPTVSSMASDLAASISPERLAALNPLANLSSASAFLGGQAAGQLLRGSAIDPLLTSLLLQQAAQSQQLMSNPSTASMLARFMLPPLAGAAAQTPGGSSGGGAVAK